MAGLVKEKVWEDVWINTCCCGCYAGCGIKVHRVNGVAVKVEGFPGSSLGAYGGVCGKGAAALMELYDPNRLTVPLRRTNPEKGIGVDPKWKEITWEEALDEIAERMRKIKADNPNKMWFGGLVRISPQALEKMIPWFGCFGGNVVGCLLWGGAAVHCGMGSHFIAGLVHGAWSIAPDWKYTNYVIQWGAAKGTSSGHSMAFNAYMGAEARARGVKVVAMDPMCHFAGGKATEWVPILPGTDSVVALAMANYMVNELNTYDIQYLKKKTNLPFLIGSDGRFVRDKKRNEPYVWDAKENKAKVYDDPSIGIDDYALEGKYQVEEVECQPAFVSFREHLKKYTPEWASQISTVSAETIKRIATEWVENARIGSTITLDGKSFPYRPVASVIFRGAEGHTNSVHACAAIDLLNELVGAVDVPGGCLGWPAVRHAYPGGGWEGIPKKGPDGVIIPGGFFVHDPWPVHKPSYPCVEGGCTNMWPMQTVSAVTLMSDREEIWRKLGMETYPEMLLNIGHNPIVNHSNCDEQIEFFKKIPFVAHIDLYANETAEAIADILLPDQHGLEKLNWSANVSTFFFNQAPSWVDWYVHTLVPVVEKPLGQCRSFMDVLTELSDRVGFRDRWNEWFNVFFKIEDEELKLKPDEKLGWNEMGDRVLKWVYSREHGLDYFKKHGYITWKKPVEDTYWRWYFDFRAPVYMEYLIDMGEKAKEIGERVGLEVEWEQYTPLISYFPAIIHKELDLEYDLICFSYRDVLHTGSGTQNNAFLSEASQLCPYTYPITMNANTAARKGLKDGDVVWLENRYGGREKGVLKLMQGQHPQTLAIAGQAGLWAKGRPIARGKGSNFDKLLKADLKHHDPVTLNIETAAVVKIHKAEEV